MSGAGEDSYIPPAKMNVQVKTKLYKNALEVFSNNHRTANREYLIEVDDNGYVNNYRKGGAHSVNAGQKLSKNKTIIHNHPSGGNFSKQDLLTVSNGW